MKIAVIGAKGMLGQDLCRGLSDQHEILAWDIEEIDITDRPRTLELLGAERPDLILNSAAFIDVEKCETEPDQAWRVNAVGAQNLALAAQHAGSALLCISTDYIFEDVDNIKVTCDDVIGSGLFTITSPDNPTGSADVELQQNSINYLIMWRRVGGTTGDIDEIGKAIVRESDTTVNVEMYDCTHENCACSN